MLRPQVFTTSRRFLPPESLGLVSCRYRPGFHLQRFSLRDSLVRLATPSAPRAVDCAASRRRPPSFRDSCTHGVRTCQAGVTRALVAVPLLMFTPSRSSSLDLGPLAGASSHGLQHSGDREPRSSLVVVLALQSFKEPGSRLPLSRPSPSVGFSVQTPPRPKPSRPLDSLRRRSSAPTDEGDFRGSFRG